MLLQQVVLVVTDYHAEGHDAYHPVVKGDSYDSQKEEAKPHIERFKKNRMPKYVCCNSNGSAMSNLLPFHQHTIVNTLYS